MKSLSTVVSLAAEVAAQVAKVSLQLLQITRPPWPNLQDHKAL